MKINLYNWDNDSEDTLIINFNEHIVDKCFLITGDFIVGVDNNNKLVNIKVLNYTRNRGWVNDLLLENDLPGLVEDDVVIFIHQGYQAAYFNKQNINNNDSPCKYFLEGHDIVQTTVKEFLQAEIDYYLKLLNKLNK